METNDDFTELFFGQDYAVKMEKFKNALLEIEKKHIDYFKSRPSKFEEHEPHDFLHNHYMIITTPPNVYFKFEEHSPLPVEIRDECTLAFRSSFSQTE